MTHGPIDISEIWDNAGVLTAFLMSVGLVVAALRIRKPWLRNSATILTSLFVVASFGLNIVVGCDLAASNTRIPPILSPDGKHVALVRWWLPGALGSDIVNVSIRKRYSPFATEVFRGAGEPPELVGGAADPKIEWLDDRRLMLTFWDKGKLEPCSAGVKPVDGIEVWCRN